jgi:hypothetical protein
MCIKGYLVTLCESTTIEGVFKCVRSNGFNILSIVHADKEGKKFICTFEDTENLDLAVVALADKYEGCLLEEVGGTVVGFSEKEKPKPTLLQRLWSGVTRCTR